MSYNASVKAESGKSLCIANITAKKKQMQSAWLSMPMAMSSNDSPVAALKSIPSTNTVESLWMPHYILEDIITAPGHGRVCCYLCGGIAFKLASCCIMKSTSKLSLFLYGISVVVSSFNCMLLYQSNHILVSSQRSHFLWTEVLSSIFLLEIAMEILVCVLVLTFLRNPSVPGIWRAMPHLTSKSHGRSFSLNVKQFNYGAWCCHVTSFTKSCIMFQAAAHPFSSIQTPQ